MAELPTLYKERNDGNTQQWVVYVVDVRGPSDVKFEVVTETGIVGGKQRATKRLIRAGKGGRTPREQAESEMRSMHAKKISRQGYSAREPILVEDRFAFDADDGNELFPLRAVTRNSRRFMPMLAVNYRTRYLDRGRELDLSSDRFVGQAKLDGERCVAHLVDGEVVLESRTGVALRIPHVAADLARMGIGTAYIDGELVIPDTSQQLIHSVVSRARETGAPGEPGEPDVSDVLFYVFDLYDPEDAGAAFRARYDRLTGLLRGAVPLSAVVIVKTYLLKRAEDIQNMHHRFVDDGYEGIIIRRDSAPYVFGRTPSLMKWKYQLESDFEIVGYTASESRSAELGAIIWTCITKSGDEFNVRPRGSVEARRKMFDDDPDRFIGKTLQVFYEALTDAGVPKNPRSRLEPKLA